MKTLKVFIASAFSLILYCCSCCAQNNSDTLFKGFFTPPNTAKPRVLWMWLDGNVTKDGIAKDLVWMKRVGIAGFMIYDLGMEMPQIVEKRLIYMTPEWKDAFLFTTKLADSLGLEMGIVSSPGWTPSGGPWVTPAQAMKKLVWSEIRVEGGQTFTDTLSKPPTTTGSFQNIANGRGSVKYVEYYDDVAVIAYRVPENDMTMAELQPKVTSSTGKFELSALTDGDLARSVLLQVPIRSDSQNDWIQFEFKRPEKVHSITIVSGDSGGPNSRTLEASDDGIQRILK